MDPKKQLEELGVKPVQGQNFLESPEVIEALVEAGEVDGETVLEIGAGTGSITAKLVERAEKVYALETDTTLSRHLEDKFPRLDVINGDFLEYSVPEEVTRCVSNLPFQISSEAVEKLGREQLQSSLLLQEEVADKLVAEPGSGDYGPFTVKARYFFVPVKLRAVSRDSYYPPPEVDTAIVKLYPNRQRWNVDDGDAFFEATRALFTHRRKKVRNSFVDARHIFGIEKSRARDLRDDVPHSEKRVVDLEIPQIADIARFVADLTRDL